MSEREDIDPAVIAALQRLGLLRAGKPVLFTPLAGGVSSDIWKVETAARTFCVKRALARLKVAQDWRAPVERSHYEYRWLQRVNAIRPGAAAEPLGFDAEAGLMALAWYDPAEWTLWKAALRDGHCDTAVAARLGETLAAIHNATAGKPDVAVEFATDDLFHAIRLDPYLAAAANAHPDLAPRLHALIATTASSKRALVHGDVSPKNILVRNAKPLLLDAECAWYGDPAFDLAFCLNHLLLKALWNARARDGYRALFATLSTSYLEAIKFEPPGDLERRAAHLLAALFLARVDGKSPVEYVTDATDKDKVRRTARSLLITPCDRLALVADTWDRELAA